MLKIHDKFTKKIKTIKANELIERSVILIQRVRKRVKDSKYKGDLNARLLRDCKFSMSFQTMVKQK